MIEKWQELFKVQVESYIILLQTENQGIYLSKGMRSLEK